MSDAGEVAGSVTGGCVEPAVYGEARDVLSGGAPRLKTYGIADDEAFEVGLPCGGTVHIFVDRLDPELVAPIAEAVRHERPIALEIAITGENAGAKRLVTPTPEEGFDALWHATAGPDGWRIEPLLTTPPLF